MSDNDLMSKLQIWKQFKIYINKILSSKLRVSYSSTTDLMKY